MATVKGKLDCFWGAEKCVPGSNMACSGCKGGSMGLKTKTGIVILKGSIQVEPFYFSLSCFSS